MSNELNGKRVAILATDGFEQVELEEPRKALQQAGAETVVVSPHEGSIRGWNQQEWGVSVPVDLALGAANPNNFDAILLPGGVMNPDKLRTIPAAVRFAKSFFEQGKPVAAICHGAWTLVEAGVLNGYKLTSWPSLQTDIRNAGGEWVDEQVVVSNGLITSRKPDDIEAFNKKMIEEIAEGTHDRTLTAASPLIGRHPVAEQV